MSDRVIPVVDLKKFTDGDDAQRKEFVDEIGQAFHKVGFVGVRNHGVPQEIVDSYYEASKAFFSLPVEQKRAYQIPGLAGQRGYTAFGTEKAKQSQVADLKEFYQLGQVQENEDKNEYPENPYTREIPEFTEQGIKLYKAFEKSGGSLLRAIALHLELDENYFDDKIENGHSILRSIHYPPITHEPKSAIRAEQHEDINLITLLVGASAGGLQLLNTEDEWLDIVPGDDEIVINVGDMLQRLTNNYLISTTHRVVNPPKSEWHKPRLSIPFFLHPKSDMRLDCLDFCVTKKRPVQYGPTSAGEYLDERLREIGLKK